ncbi:pyrimidine-nucleoside phosphorylase [Thermincola potens]|uniref:Pyrimidine-nucleoside phosphorylase n=1 Tax=Thermincola potens (strain JR) TaxID=635013 RepID=D5X7E2_THEPJ|nr:pyrimidine-nucleoside phosphorylase [Thermincola potens]ADG82512.1 pyrimidine-nucleoside phosphorylase [Thermincola potens JR]
MRAYDIILKKRNGQELSTEEINFLIEGYMSGKVADYQMSAWAMAVFFRGMTERETADLTMAMVRSGEQVDLSPIQGIKVDKHSTGGVGDKTTLVLGPLVAAAGVPVAKMSGRGLGHTGGTIDKLESIPGFQTGIKKEQFFNNVNQIKIAVAGQTGNLTPADKKLYALRDVTATVDSIPLIASSIMSKKIAAGADAIVLDVKTGCGAFMKTEEDAFKLAAAMVGIGAKVGRKTTAVVTDMDQPLGNTVGNALEVKEAILTLKDKGPADLTELCYTLGSRMLVLGGRANTYDEGRKILEELLKSGAALSKLKELVEAQGGDGTVIENEELLPDTKYSLPLKAAADGYVYAINAEQVGIAAMVLGAGRETKEDVIDPAVGIIINKKRGEEVKSGEILATIYYNDEHRARDAERILLAAYTIKNEKPLDRPLIFGYVDETGSYRI